MLIREGGVELDVPEQSGEGVDDAVFYNPDQELNRDLTVAVLRAYRERERERRADGAGDSAGGPDDDPGGESADSSDGSTGDPDDRSGDRGPTTYLDATAATGVRGVRAAADGWAATLCDRDPEAVALCRANLARNDLGDAEVLHEDANVLLHRRRFDVVDLDPFGTPMPFADAAVRRAGLLCVTATDTAPLCGAHFRSGVRSYDAVPRNTEYHPEMGLRVLVSALVRTAARHDRAATPLVTHATRHYARTYLDLESGARAANDRIDRLGHVHHCPECLYRRAERGLTADPPERCPHCGSDQVVTAGLLWLGRLQDGTFLSQVRRRVDDRMGTAGEARDLVDRLAAELATPTHYDQHRLCRRWGRPASAMDDFLERLRAAGHRASRTHHGGTTFKTDADVAAIREATAEDDHKSGDESGG